MDEKWKRDFKGKKTPRRFKGLELPQIGCLISILGSGWWMFMAVKSPGQFPCDIACFPLGIVLAATTFYYAVNGLWPTTLQISSQTDEALMAQHTLDRESDDLKD